MKHTNTFAWNAFKANSIPPSVEYEWLYERVVTYCKGLPLALEILVCFLCGKSVTEWKSALNRLQELPNKEIVAALRISFDGLEKTEKNIFLDVACFFKGEDREFVTRIPYTCGFYSELGMPNLVDKSLLISLSAKNNKIKSLLTILENNILWMHDLLEEMGREIVGEESRNEAGRQSRLWRFSDILHVSKNESVRSALLK